MQHQVFGASPAKTGFWSRPLLHQVYGAPLVHRVVDAPGPPMRQSVLMLVHFDLAMVQGELLLPIVIAIAYCGCYCLLLLLLIMFIVMV